MADECVLRPRSWYRAARDAVYVDGTDVPRTLPQSRLRRDSLSCNYGRASRAAYWLACQRARCLQTALLFASQQRPAEGAEVPPASQCIEHALGSVVVLSLRIKHVSRMIRQS